MNNTHQILINWDKGSTFAERMSGKILGLEGYSDIDPQSPAGGPDGTKDLICYKDDKKYVVGCYFPIEQKKFKDISDKFNGDFEGVSKNNADGFIFITNQKITPTERMALCSGHIDSTIYHGERICGILDSPKGYGVRLEYLGIELTKEEQLSFLNSHLDLKESYQEIKNLLGDLKKTSMNLMSTLENRDIGIGQKLTTLPIAGVKFSSRISIEDLYTIHNACLYDAPKNNTLYGFRKVQVWIGTAGSSFENADFIPPDSTKIPSLIVDLLTWWREKYMKILYAEKEDKIFAIAEFHEKFLSIHPFLDGNGRVARVIASIQCRDLLDEEITFENIEKISDYYNALQNARKGNRQELIDIFMSLAK